MNGQQVERLGIQQEQEAIQERERGIIGLSQELVAGFGLLVKAAAAVLHETFGQVGKDLVEDASPQTIAHFLGKGLGAEPDLIEETALTPGPSPGGRGEQSAPGPSPEYGEMFALTPGPSPEYG